MLFAEPLEEHDRVVFVCSSLSTAASMTACSSWFRFNPYDGNTLPGLAAVHLIFSIPAKSRLSNQRLPIFVVSDSLALTPTASGLCSPMLQDQRTITARKIPCWDPKLIVVFFLDAGPKTTMATEFWSALPLFHQPTSSRV